MLTRCTIRWRPSGGRGEFEFVPAHSLEDKHVDVLIPELNVMINAEITGAISQGKPRLRKDDANNRKKLHLVPLVMAAARLPDPAREDKAGKAVWPLENKGFIISHMGCEVIESDAQRAILRPLGAQILHSDITIDLHERFVNIANDIKNIAEIKDLNGDLARTICDHYKALQLGLNDKALRDAADAVIRIQGKTFGDSNTAAISTILALPSTPLEEDIQGNEGRVLTRLHAYKERDRSLIKKAKALFKKKHGKLFCESCGFEAGSFYGSRGENRIQAHHRLPVEELLSDSITKAEDLAMVCPNCHDIIHAKRPWISIEELHGILMKTGNHYFK